MNGTNVPMSLTMAIKDYFGYKQLSALREELKKLTPEDREDLRQGLAANGYAIKAAE